MYLYPPPFQTVARAVAGSGRGFYPRFGALDQLVPEAAVGVADFGLGSDAPVLLDYRAEATKPRVIRLRWPGGGAPIEWVTLAPNFSTFLAALGS